MMTRRAFRILMIFEAFFRISESSKVKYSYFTVGQTVLLKCTDGKLNLKSAVWAGPVHNSIRKGTPVSVIDNNGKRSKWKVSQYTDDGRVESSLLHRNRLRVTGNYDLQIFKTSSLDEGLYMCYLGPMEVFSRIILHMKTLPSNMTFANATKEKILHGKENTTLHILCSVQDGIPDSLSIIRNNKTVKSGEDSSLEYSLLPTRLDNGLKYTCEARSSLLKQPMRKMIHLDIKYRPVVSLMQNGTQEIIKGTSYTLCCDVDSNPLPTSTSLMNGSQEILVTHNVTETCFIFRNVSQYDQGNYTCIAYNIVGNGPATFVIRVNCELLTIYS
ncbi:opioid-binding protein/cell adhesion molecule-like [Mytilus trossulus]|uniref:opioid-binding protein/cell adhesion molecule-like n=1 Tax=Mytilus trossulus TaxID=6551 RepID=UPI003004D6E4